MRSALTWSAHTHRRPGVAQGVKKPGVSDRFAHTVIATPLRQVGKVAYLRLASVYRAFRSADDFEDEIAIFRVVGKARAGRTTHTPRHQRRNP
jgi:transcriptional repressor NrdR